MVEADDKNQSPFPEEGSEFDLIPRPKPKKRQGRQLIILFAGLLSITVFAGWFFLGDQLVDVDEDANIPLIKAEIGPAKVRPKGPSGMDVPDRDKLVYERMQGEDGVPPGVERLLPPPETPLPVPRIPSSKAPTTEEVLAVKRPDPVPPIEEPQLQSNGDTKPKSGPKDPETLAKDLLQKKVEAVRKKTNGSQPATKPSAAKAEPKKKSAVVKPAAQKPVTKTPQSKEVASPVKKAPLRQADSGLRVQLSAVRSPKIAAQEWKRLSSKYPDLLGGLKMFVTKADLGPGKGVFYRLRAGPLADENAARALCQGLAKRKASCLVVRPKK
jgi:hypothetical protein